MQDTKLLWFTHVLSRNLQGRAMKWVGDVTQPPSKDNQPGLKVSTPDESLMQTILMNNYSLSLILVSGMTGLSALYMVATNQSYWNSIWMYYLKQHYLLFRNKFLNYQGLTTKKCISYASNSPMQAFLIGQQPSSRWFRDPRSFYFVVAPSYQDSKVPWSRHGWGEKAQLHLNLFSM